LTGTCPILPTHSTARQRRTHATAWNPPPIVDELNQVLNRILRGADMQAWLQDQGLDPIGGSPAAFDREIRADFDKWGKTTRRLGIRPQ